MSKTNVSQHNQNLFIPKKSNHSKMKKREITFFIIILFLVSSCSSITGPTTTVSSDTGGIDIAFLDKRPPTDEIQEDEEFTVGVYLTNNLEEDITANLCISDTPASSYGGIEDRECRSVEISKAQKYEEEVVPTEKEERFGPYSYTNLPLGIRSTIFTAEINYYILTQASTQVCLKQDPTMETLEPCESDEIFTTEIIKETAPLTVSKIEKQIIPTGDSAKIKLDITLKKASEGEVIVDEYNRDPLVGLAISLSGTEHTAFICTPLVDNKVKLMEDSLETTISCSADLTLNELYYTDNLGITLGYTYINYISTNSIELKISEEYEGGEPSL